MRHSFGLQRVMQTLGVSLDAIAPGEVSLSLPYADTLTQQNGFLHGGIVATVLDSACGYAAFSLMPPGMLVLTVEFKVNLLSPAKGTRFIATGRVNKPGRTLSVVSGEMLAVDGSRQTSIASLVGTFMAVAPRDDLKHRD